MRISLRKSVIIFILLDRWDLHEHPVDKYIDDFAGFPRMGGMARIFKVNYLLVLLVRIIVGLLPCFLVTLFLIGGGRKPADEDANQCA